MSLIMKETVGRAGRCFDRHGCLLATSFQTLRFDRTGRRTTCGEKRQTAKRPRQAAYCEDQRQSALGVGDWTHAAAYDLSICARQDGVATIGRTRVAWDADPDGKSPAVSAI